MNNLQWFEGESLPQVKRHAAVIVAAAHDINEQVTLMSSALELLRGTDSEARASITEIRASLQRLGMIAHDLTAYATRNGGRQSSTRTAQAVQL